MKKIAFVALIAFGLASAAGSLWGPNVDEFPSLQVKVPSAAACWEEHTTIDEDNPCYQQTAGWWFGYTDQDGTKVEVRKGGSYTSFETGVSISDESDGASLIDEDGMYIRFEAGPAAKTDAPTIAGIGFNYNKPEEPQNIDSWGGYCISYSLTGTKLQFELGWDEAGKRYDTWYAELQTGTKAVDLKWTGGTQNAKIAGDFKKDGYDTGPNDQPIKTATQQAWSVKIRLKNGTTSKVNSEFVLFELGKPGECGEHTSSPIIARGTAVNSMRFSIADRMLSMVSSKAHSVQVINLYGAVVQAQTLSPGAKMDLSGLPSGVYMVRATDVGYVSKFVLK